jgi:diphthamide biosynthesis methyltransferase
VNSLERLKTKYISNQQILNIIGYLSVELYNLDSSVNSNISNNTISDKSIFNSTTSNSTTSNSTIKKLDVNTIPKDIIINGNFN